MVLLLLSIQSYHSRHCLYSFGCFTVEPLRHKHHINYLLCIMLDCNILFGFCILYTYSTARSLILHIMGICTIVLCLCSHMQPARGLPDHRQYHSHKHSPLYCATHHCCLACHSQHQAVLHLCCLRTWSAPDYSSTLRAWRHSSRHTGWHAHQRCQQLCSFHMHFHLQLLRC